MGRDPSAYLGHDGFGTRRTVMPTIAGRLAFKLIYSPHAAKKSEDPWIFYDHPRICHSDKGWMEEQFPRNYRVADAFPVSSR